MNTSLDFGYPWWLSYGHLPLLAISAALLFLGFRRNWSKLPMILLGVVALWSAAAFLVVRIGFDINGRAALPTESFFRSGVGRVLDIGAGTGRSSIMVLEARPKSTLVALDLFGDSFDTHFGHSGSPQQRLLANLQAAGVASRAEIRTADMRELPFEPAAFDAIVSAYAMDHLNSKGIDQSLGEAARVIKPGGDFLLILVGNEPWVKFAFGPLLMHSHLRDQPWWHGHVKQAGFEILEEGTRPGTLYFLAHRG